MLIIASNNNRIIIAVPFFQNSMSYGSHGVKDNPERKFDNFFGGTVHRKLTAAYANIIGKSKMLKVA